MLSGQEVAALFGVLLTPIVGAFSGLFLYVKAQTDGRLRDKDGEVARLIAERDDNVKTLRGERDRVLAQLEANNQQMWRFADVLADLKDAIKASAPR